VGALKFSAAHHTVGFPQGSAVVDALFDPISERPLPFSLCDNAMAVPLLWPGLRLLVAGGRTRDMYELVTAIRLRLI